MLIEFKSYKNPSELQQKLYDLLPLGSSLDRVKQFSVENKTTWSGLYPKSSLGAEKLLDVSFDTSVVCSTKAAGERFPWSLISLSNGWIWLIYFYFMNEKLVKIDIELANNGL